MMCHQEQILYRLKNCGFFKYVRDKWHFLKLELVMEFFINLRGRLNMRPQLSFFLGCNVLLLNVDSSATFLHSVPDFRCT
jgi:hypothetical protein